MSQWHPDHLRGHSADAAKAAASERQAGLTTKRQDADVRQRSPTAKADQSLRSDPATIDQLSSIGRDALAAPEGMNDDLADAYALAVAALQYRK